MCQYVILLMRTIIVDAKFCNNRRNFHCKQTTSLKCKQWSRDYFSLVRHQKNYTFWWGILPYFLLYRCTFTVLHGDDFEIEWKNNVRHVKNRRFIRDFVDVDSIHKSIINLPQTSHVCEWQMDRQKQNNMCIGSRLYLAFIGPQWVCVNFK